MGRLTNPFDSIIDIFLCLDNRVWGSSLLSDDKRKAAAKTANKERSAEAASQPGEGVKGNKSFIEAQATTDPADPTDQSSDDTEDDTEDTSDSSSDEEDSDDTVVTPPPKKLKKKSEKNSGNKENEQKSSSKDSSTKKNKKKKDKHIGGAYNPLSAEERKRQMEADQIVHEMSARNFLPPLMEKHNRPHPAPTGEIVRTIITAHPKDPQKQSTDPAADPDASVPGYDHLLELSDNGEISDEMTVGQIIKQKNVLMGAIRYMFPKMESRGEFDTKRARMQTWKSVMSREQELEDGKGPVSKNNNPKITDQDLE